MAAIKDLVTPKSAIREVGRRARAGAGRLRELAREHPLPAVTLGVGAVGLGWLAFEGARGRTVLRVPVRWRRAAAPAGPLKDAARRAGRGLGDLVEERPLAVGAASLAIGLLAGLALPATRHEDELLGDTRDELLDSARAAGQEALDRSREVARDAVERVKESVREQELTPEQLAAKARHVARDTADTLRDAEREVVQGLAGGVEPGTPPRL
jgi:ElaB/YqjD/DUF883 family membrane-anchored ribosome-binding protein